MDMWLGNYDRSDLYSDEGPPFGHQGIGDWHDIEYDFMQWLLRRN